MVLREAAALNIPARGLRWEGEKPETGVQAAARKARYGMLATAMAEDGAELLLTAHHLGDQAETVLMRLAHGSGIDGLRGMDRFITVEGCKIFRPLLAVEPETLEMIVGYAGLTPARDPSNGDRHYERVRWRQMLPELEELGLDLRRLGDFATRIGRRRLTDCGGGGAGPCRAAAYRAGRGCRIAACGGGGAQPRGDGATAGPGAPDRRWRPQAACAGGARKRCTASRLSREALRPTTLHGCVIQSDGLTISVRPEGARRTASLLTAG